MKRTSLERTLSTQPVAGIGLDWAMPLATRLRRRPARRYHWRAFLGRWLLNLATPTWMAVDLLIVCAGTFIGQTTFVWWQSSAGVLGEFKLWLVFVALGCSVLLAGLMFGLYERHTLSHRG